MVIPEHVVIDRDLATLLVLCLALTADPDEVRRRFPPVWDAMLVFFAKFKKFGDEVGKIAAGKDMESKAIQALDSLFNAMTAQVLADRQGRS